MGFLLLLLAFVPTPKPSAEALMDFSRFVSATGHRVVLVEFDGTAREGVLESANADAVTMRFAGSERVFEKTAIASADRLKDGNKDGLIKGALFGVLLGAIVTQAYGSDTDGRYVLSAGATYAAIGWTIDALNKNRQPIYRAAPALAPSVKMSFRF